MNAIPVSSFDSSKENGGGHGTDTDSDVEELPDYYQPISATADDDSGFDSDQANSSFNGVGSRSLRLVVLRQMGKHNGGRDRYGQAGIGMAGVTGPTGVEPAVVMRGIRDGNEPIKPNQALIPSPNLEQVKLSAAENGDNVSESVVEVDDGSGIEICNSPFTLAHLNSAALTGIGDSLLEMGFIGILLSSSPTLQKMTIKADKSSKLYPRQRGEDKLLKNMMCLQCASTQAELSFL